MASFFNLTFDTTAPTLLSVKINGDALYTASVAATLDIWIDDSATTGYQMKVWGVDGVAEEANAKWETFATSKNITLPNSNGLKTVYVKVRDDVGNESAVVSDTITLDTTDPVVTISSGPDKTKISTVEGFDAAIFNFMANVVFDEYDVRVVPTINSTHDAGVSLWYANAGYINDNGQQIPNAFPADTNILVTITGEQLSEKSPDDGVKIIKVFVHTPGGIWSVT